MNLAEDPDGVIRALVEVEGEKWLERQKAGQFKGCSVFDAIEKLKTTRVSDSTSSIFIIYGQDGWNRYRVCASGEVEFIELMAGHRDDVKRARKAGFKIV